MKKILHWLDENLEEFLLVFFLIAMTLIMGIQVFCRYVLGTVSLLVGGDHPLSFLSGLAF